ncbi:MAG: hypothetical protein KDC54_20270 [Lewinella sp.]|nr:hypothetical protein [Lewinella sp.]
MISMSVLSEALVQIDVKGTNIPITIDQLHPNLEIGIAALAADFQTSGQYKHWWAYRDKPFQLLFQPAVDPTLKILQIYAILPMEEDSSYSGKDATHYRYIFGKGDGEGGNPGIMLDIEYCATMPVDCPEFGIPTNGLTVMPETFYLTEGNYVEEIPARYSSGPNPTLYQWFRLTVPTISGLKELQEHLVFHVYSLESSPSLKAIIRAGQLTDGYLFAEQGQLLLVPLLAPVQSQDGTDTIYTFELGDPEKDGVVKVRQI